MSGTFADHLVVMTRDLGFSEITVEGDHVRIGVPHEACREVMVFVRSCGEMHGKEVLEFSSHGLPLPADDGHKMPLLILALQRNADVILGHWGLDEGPDSSVLRVFHSQISETMDPPELRGAILAVADEFATLKAAIATLFGPPGPAHPRGEDAADG